MNLMPRHASINVIFCIYNLIWKNYFYIFVQSLRLN